MNELDDQPSLGIRVEPGMGELLWFSLRDVYDRS